MEWIRKNFRPLGWSILREVLDLEPRNLIYLSMILVGEGMVLEFKSCVVALMSSWPEKLRAVMERLCGTTGRKGDDLLV